MRTMENIIIIGKNVDFKKYNFDNKFIIGVDYGAFLAVKNDITLDVAIGDFDSVSKDEFDLIKKNAKKVEVLPEKKDYTDTVYALNLIENSSKTTILGGIMGDRIEHFIANLNLLKDNHNLVLLDDNSKIIILEEGNHNIFKENYYYFSIFGDLNTIITLEGFKYPLTDYVFLQNDSLGISNEIIDDFAYIKIKSGKIILICSKKD